MLKEEAIDDALLLGSRLPDFRTILIERENL